MHDVNGINIIFTSNQFRKIATNVRKAAPDGR